ncbi:hypothetical protein BDZ90DRAFT_281623 [Jaminaea rosea]|uniref:Peregrin n=1 Tax=Jaminaea rosea TaxID=1569628 RepID=A0A316UJM3_9BASI|nr:hypothetical protein BDZ90DRAFT_281623 [Jaminaea rosea]PWN25419.1 hypothetical protein BDZ90DRAFT_281623 [Jaminaea rosea]
MTGPPQPIGSNLPLASSLPKVSFRRIPAQEAQTLSLPAGVSDSINVGYGFNDGESFDKPEHYIRFVEPIEADLKRQVEYDMDEQDKEWIDALNAERKKEGSDAVSYETFEIVIDRLEKEWFDLMKRVPPKPTPAAIGPDGEVVNQSEDTECAICDDGECENSNAIVFCDGCNLAVHQDCYGIPYIPEGQWLCRKCTVSPDRAVSCVLCPNEGGAFKQTTQGKWAHLLCAMWIPETGVSNPVYMEPIDSVERIPKARWKLQCYLCRHRHGACIQCDSKSCFVAFHVTCARKAGLLINAPRQRHEHHHHGDDDDEGETLKAMCHKHQPKHLRRLANASAPQDDDAASGSAGTGASTPVLPTIKPASRKITIRRGANGSISAVVANPPAHTATKSARAYKKSYRAGPPLVPAYILSRVFDYMSKVHLRRKQPLIVQIAKFWSLKREARRGAPLLKRLHLEPWTAMSAPKELSEAERTKKLRFVMAVRADLEKQRMLVELVRKREREKLKQADIIRSALDAALFPAHAPLKDALAKITALDRSGLFMSPVSRSEVPDYYDVVKEPMEWATIAARVDDHYYQRVAEFRRDVMLVPNNAILYNKPETSFHRAAVRIKKAVEPMLEALEGLGRWHSEEARERGVEVGKLLEELELEPPLRLLDAFGERGDEGKAGEAGEAGEEDTQAEPAKLNIVDDLLRQFYRPPSPPPPPPPPPAADPSPAPSAAPPAAAASSSPKRKGKEGATAPKRRRIEAPAPPRTPRPAPAAAAPRRGRASALAAAAPAAVSPAVASASAVSSPLTSSPSSPANPALRVSDVSDHDSFKRFEDGWILPKGTRRATTAGKSSSEDEGRSGGKATDIKAGEATPRPRAVRRSAAGKASPAAPTLDPLAPPASARSQRTRRPSNQAAPGPSTAPAGSPLPTPDLNSIPKPSVISPAGTLVWAKYGSHPFYPAEVFSEKSALVPPTVLSARPAPSTIPTGQRVHLVRFFDRARSWGWASTGLCRLLLEDEELDSGMVSAVKARQREAIRKAMWRAGRARDGLLEEGE